MVIRGGDRDFAGIIDEAWATRMAKAGWRWSFHTHPVPHGTSGQMLLRSSEVDRKILQVFVTAGKRQKESGIWNSFGEKAIFDPKGDRF